MVFHAFANPVSDIENHIVPATRCFVPRNTAYLPYLQGSLCHAIGE